MKKASKSSSKTNDFKNTVQFKDHYQVILSFALTALLCCIIFTILDVAPFGKQSVLKVDLFHQYAPFLEELRSRILHGQNLFYSWESGLGKDFLTQTAYYSSSPLDFLVLLSPRKAISEFMLLLIMLKMCLCGASFTGYLKEHYKKNDLSVVMFGLLYAFCSFVTCYYWNVMWLDTVALFPMVALAVEKLIHKNKHLFYYICLTLTMIVNFYLAVLVCVFTALYYLVTTLSVYELKKDWNVIWQRSVKFAITSILCAVSAMFILLPVAIALGQTKTSQTAFPSFSIYKSVFQLIPCHFIGAVPAVLARNEDLPNVYCGIITMMLLPVYFANTSIPKKEKLLKTAFLGFALLCCIIKPLDFCIHGMHFPANLPHRFTFMYSFMLLILAYEAFINLKNCKFKWIAFTAGVYAAAIVISEYVIVPRLTEVEVTLSGTDVLLNLTAIGAYLLLLFLLQGSKKKTQNLLTLVLFAGIIAEVLFSACDNISDFKNREKYIAYIDGTDAALAAIDAQEEDLFYRTEYRRLQVVNEGSMNHFNGFSQFSSLAPGGISAFIKQFGIPSTGNSYRYYDPTPLVSAIFNMKYLLNRDGEIARPDHLDYLGQFDNVYAYRNQRVLPLGFLVNSQISELDPEQTNPFLFQNDFVHLATSEQGDMFTLLDADSIETENMKITTNGGNNDFTYELENPAKLSLIPKVSASFTAKEDQYLYLYVDAENASRVVYHTNREKQDRELACGNSIIDIGPVVKDEVVTVEFTLTKRGKFETQYRPSGTVLLYAATYDDSVFDRAYQELSGQGMTITSFKDTHIEGTVHADKDQQLFLSIPYVDGWNLKLDGQSVEKTAIGDKGVLSLAIPAGDHTITMSYRLKGFSYSLIISFIGILLMVLYSKQKKF